MRSKVIDRVRVYCPTRDDLTALKEGDEAPDIWGSLSQVVRIVEKGLDRKTRRFTVVCFVRCNVGALMARYAEDEVVPSIPIIQKWRSVVEVPWAR